MSQTPIAHTEPRRARRRRGRNKILAFAAPAAAAAVIAGASLLAVAPADAATAGTGWGTFGSTSTAYKGTFNANGTRVICAEPGRNTPTGATSALGLQDTAWLSANLTDFAGTHPTLTDNIVAGVNKVMTEDGGTSDQNLAAALEYAVRAAMYPGDADLTWTNAHQGTMDAAINFDLYSTAGAANVAIIQTDANNLLNEINSTTASSGANGNAGNPHSSFVLNSPTDATLTIDFGGADANATFTDTIQNGVFKSTGTNTITGTVGSNQVQTFEVIPQLTDPNQKLTDSGSVTAPGSAGGYAANLAVFDTGSQQTSVGAGGQAAGQPDTAPFNDPVGLATTFSPEASTQSDAKYYTEGTAPVDNVKPSLGDTSPAATSWPQDANGNYVQVTIDGTLYGPLATKPTQASSIPAGTPVAAHGSVTVGGTATDPTTQTVSLTGDTKIGAAPTSSGYYVWVESIKGDEQSSATQQFLTNGSSYDYSTDYGIADESFLAPPAVTTSTAAASTGVTTSLNGTNVPTQGLGLQVKDDISVTGNVDASAGMYVIDRHYTFANTVGPDSHVTAPAAADLVTDASTLDYTSPQIPVTAAQDYAAQFNSTKVGAGTWVETLYAADGTVLSTGKSDDTSEWTAVQQLVVTTKASANSNGTATDTATIWGTVPAGAQLASVLYNQTGATASSTDASVATAGPVGLNEGLVNGIVVTLPAVAYPSDMTKGYFVEAVYDLDGNVIAQGARGVSSETITPGSGGNGAGAGGAASTVPVVSG